VESLLSQANRVIKNGTDLEDGEIESTTRRQRKALSQIKKLEKSTLL
jgi:hypothetical protein